MKQTTEKLRSLHVEMVSVMEHLSERMPDHLRTNEARILYDAYATIGDAAGDLFDVLVRLDRLQKGVDSSG
jgi:hypothetical protein